MSTSVPAAVLVAAAVALGLAPRPVVRSAATRVTISRHDEPDGLLRRWRGGWALLAGAGTAVLLGGTAAPPAGAAAAALVWVVAGRIEPRVIRLRREEVSRDLPHVVLLLAAALSAGAAPAAAIDVVCRAMPGAAAETLGPVAARLALGADPAAVWSAIAGDPALGPLGRAMARAHRAGSPVVAAVERLAEELARRELSEVEDRARAVGVRAAVPLGLCLLPSFLLLGIVPLVAGLARSIAW